MKYTVTIYPPRSEASAGVGITFEHCTQQRLRGYGDTLEFVDAEGVWHSVGFMGFHVTQEKE